MRARGEQGLTLVEVLVVLAIIGIMSSVAMLGLGGSDRGAGVQAEAQRLATSIQLAADEALVTDRMLGLEWDAESYWFVQWSPQENAWQAYESSGLGGRHELPEEIDLVGAGETPVRIGENQGLELTVSGELDSWNVRFDGLNAAATPATNG